LWDPFPSDETFMNVYFDGDSIYDSAILLDDIKLQ